VSVDADAESKAAALSEAGTEGRIRVKTDLIKPTEGKVLISNDSLDYINEHDQSIASEVVLPFSKPSPSDHKTDIQEKKTSDLPKIDCGPAKPTKHARFDKLGNDYIMETILNVHTELKTRKSPIQDVKVPDRAIKKPDTSEARKRKSTPNDNEIKRDDKRPRKSDDESDKVRSGDHFKAHTRKTHDSNNKPTNDDIFDKLLREGPVNKVFTQRITDQTVKRESTQGNSLEALKNRGYTTVSENKKERNMTPSQSTISQLHDSSRYRENPRHSTHPDSDKRRDVKKPGYHTSSSNSQLERRYPEKRHISIPTVDTSPKRFIRNSANSYSSKSDPCTTTRDYKSRDRRMSTEHPHNVPPNSSRSEGGVRQDDDKFSWIDKFSGSGLFDTPSNLFMPPGAKREDASSRK
jgi:hypothetical protein